LRGDDLERQLDVPFDPPRQCPGIGGPDITLGAPDRVDLGAYEVPVDEIPGQEGKPGVVAGALQPAVHETPAEIGTSTGHQIHQKKRAVRENVDPAQLRSEFDAIEGNDFVVDPGHVSEVQVAVAFADEAGRPPGLEGLGQLGVACVPPSPEARQVACPGGIRDHRFERRKVVEHRFHDGRDAAPGLVGRRDRGALVESCDVNGDIVDVVSRQLAVGELTVELVGLLETAHADGVLDSFARPSHAQPVVRACDWNNVSVQTGRQPAIEAQLFHAEVLAALQAGEVQEPEVDRFLQLVGPPPGEKHEGNVGFYQLDSIDVMGVGAGIAQSRDQRVPIYMLSVHPQGSAVLRRGAGRRTRHPGWRH
jgi:hypothetical protein